jgi:hypothetical protein
MHGAGLTSRLFGFVVALVAAVLAIRWAVEQLRPLLPLLAVVVIVVLGWRVSLFVRRRF